VVEEVGEGVCYWCGFVVFVDCVEIDLEFGQGGEGLASVESK